MTHEHTNRFVFMDDMTKIRMIISFFQFFVLCFATHRSFTTSIISRQILLLVALLSTEVVNIVGTQSNVVDPVSFAITTMPCANVSVYLVLEDLSML